jgi:hypothetical protein
MSRALWRTRWVWSTVIIVTAVAVPGALDFAAAQSRTETPAITATCTVTDEFPLPTSPETVPVMVTYMKNSRRPGDDVETKLSKNRLRDGFAREGEFNSVWRPKGIELALIGFRACSYALGGSFEPDREDVPKPDVKDVFESVFLRVLHDHNTRTIKRGAREVGFRGLDLYLWWRIAGFPGFGVRPRFGREREVSGRGNDEPLFGRPGAIWMDKECVGEGSCPGLLAHEVGHFFGLCHCCHRADEDPRCINGLKPEYCPGLGLRAPERVFCTIDGLQKRLMSATNPHKDPRRRDLVDCEVQTAQEGARRVLKVGANGLPNTRGR